MRTIRYVVEPYEHGITCDLLFRATAVAVEEPRQLVINSIVVCGSRLGLVWGRRDRGSKAASPSSV